MGRKVIGTVIILATLSVIGVVLTQLLWLDSAFRVQKEQVELQQQREDQMAKQFNDRVSIALTNVAEQILSLNKDPSQLFEAVKQLRPNYFAVSINDTLHPYLLEALLIKEFDRRQIHEDFEYGIYDCFTDSIVYGNYVPMTDTSGATAKHPNQLLKMNEDGHYFGVYFPRRMTEAVLRPERSMGTWIFPAVVSLIVFVFFVYSVWVIMQQKRISEIKNDFIGNMTHELKTPISTIALSSEVLMDPGIRDEPERLAHYASIIHSENRRLKEQVERVLQLATMDRKDMELDLENVDLHELIREMAQAFAIPLQERKGKIDLSLQAVHAVVRGDRMHLSNMLHNLIDNALKYSSEDPVIELRTISRNGRLLIEVQDQGIGISGADQKHIFERFYRVHTGNVHDVKGFGLGLHYVKYIVETHGGSIHVDSEVGVGSTFTVDLPTTDPRT